MSDLIERSAVIDLIDKYTQNMATDYWGTNYGIPSDVFEDEIMELPSAQPEQQWIPCSERLPEVPCLVSDANNNFPYVPAGIITLEDKEHGKWAIDGKWFERMMLDGEETDMLIYSNRIVAWIPLPKPYKEGDTK